MAVVAHCPLAGLSSRLPAPLAASRQPPIRALPAPSFARASASQQPRRAVSASFRPVEHATGASGPAGDCRSTASTGRPADNAAASAAAAVAVAAALLPTVSALAVAESSAEAAGGDASLALAGLAAAAGAGAVFGGVKAFAHFRLQYIVAAMVGRHVPRASARAGKGGGAAASPAAPPVAPGGAVVVDLHTRNGRNLYYMPDDVSKMMAVRATVQPSLLKQQAVSAGVPLDVLPDGLAALSRIQTDSVDAVVSVDGFKGLSPSDAHAAADAIARILKANRPLIFIELYSGDTSPPTQEGQRPEFKWLPESVLPLYDRVDYDFVLPMVDCHVAGVAMRNKEPATVGATSSSSSSSSGSGSSSTVGFGKGGKKQR